MARYKVAFFQLNITPTPQVPDAYSALVSLCGAQGPIAASVGGFTREIYGLFESNHRDAVYGRFRKFRTTDLPEVGEVGRDAEELNLENRGLIEQNFFAIYRQHSLLLWHVNNHANGTGQFNQFLAGQLGVGVNADPLLQRDAIERLLTNEAEFRDIEVTVPRPTNPELYLEEDFSRGIMELLAGSNGDSIKVTIRTDGRFKQKRGIVNRIKRSLAELAQDAGAQRARVTASQDGVEHPIDLIADRIVTSMEVDHEGKYPQPSLICAALDDAKAEQQAAIEAYFGVADRALA